MPGSGSPPPPSRRRRRSRSPERGYNDSGRSAHRSRSPRRFSRERQRDRGSPDRRGTLHFIFFFYVSSGVSKHFLTLYTQIVTVIDTLDGTQGHDQDHQ